MDHILASASVRAVLTPGENDVELTLPSPVRGLAVEDHGAVVWHRIRYRIMDSAAKSRGSGIIAISRARANLFVLQVFPQPPGSSLRTVSVMVRAVHPVTQEPVPGVRVSARIRGAAATSTASGTVDSGGVVTLAVPVSESNVDDDPVIAITGTMGDFRQVAGLQVNLNRGSAIRVDTDKALYQPGQTIRIRTIAFGPDTLPLANSSMRIQVMRDYQPVYSTSARTSRFGVATSEWALPDNAPTGQYTVTASAAWRNGQRAQGSADVAVSRYELPQFIVKAASTKPWYVFGDPVTVHVAADYVFGKPLPAGEVEIVERAPLHATPSRPPVRSSGSLVNGRAEITFKPGEWRDSTGAIIRRRDYDVRVKAPGGAD